MTDNNSQKLRRRGRIIRYAPLVLWIGIVLFASTEQGAMQNTSRLVRPLFEFLFPNAPEETLIVYHGYIRKLAHVAEYAILAFWASRAFYGSSVNFLRRFWFAAAFVSVLLVASIDETNQSFLAARTGSIYDVLLDASGGFFMISIFYWRNNRRKRSEN